MRIAVFFIFLILLAHDARAETIITVEVNDSGNALWTLEKRQLLTAPELNEWEGLIKTGQGIPRYREIPEFNDMIQQFLQSARNFSNRPMDVEKANISYQTVKTPSGGFGIISYSFWWHNFSRTGWGSIFVGEAFSEGLVLAQDSVFIIKIPDGYDVKSASPDFEKRDGNRLIWEGTPYRRFGKGEPEVVLMRIGYQQASWLIIGTVVVLISGTLALFWKRKHSSANRTEIDTTFANRGDITTSLPDIAAGEPMNFPEMMEEDLLEEEKIKQFLIKSGGQAYQSDIVKEIGVSKSKISMVLSKMKNDGNIIKVRKGKENLIRLVRR